MDYDAITRDDQITMVKASLKELEAQHYGMCIQITANKGLPGASPRELEQKRDAIATGIRNLKREYADLLAEPVEEPEPHENGRVLYPVGAE